jgi:cardiolipin synthase
MSPLINKIDSIATAANNDSDDCAREAAAHCPQKQLQIKYLNDHAGFPVFKNTETEYYPTGETFFESMLKELKKAERYIFLEYFIISEGKMWNSILDILKEKAQAGVDVRIIYDDFGCLLYLPRKYPAMLAEFGIECRAFNRFRPILTGLQNNRDHRKICSIDGKVAFTGGVNIGDEYINEVEKYGRWKDAAVKLTGEAAWALTTIFLKNWLLTAPEHKSVEDISSLRPITDTEVKFDGFVQPYCDSPLDAHHVGEHVYLHLIDQAQKYLYIMTPYLIIDDGLLTALTLAAKSGVDIRIVVPCIPDKKIVNQATKSYYTRLIEAGVKVYEYKRGFNHSKIVICDDKIATVGSVNFDYRSFYLSFECGIWMYETSSINDMLSDYNEMLNDSVKISLEDCKSNLIVRVFRAIIAAFAPLF